MAAGAAIGAAVIGAAATTYAVSQSKPQAPKLPPPLPKLPDSGNLAANAAKGEEEAKSAGGTILAKPGQLGVGDAPHPRMSHLPGTC